MQLKKAYFFFIAIPLLAVGACALADAPSTPADFTATSTSPSSVTLSWAASAGAANYQVFRDGTTTPAATVAQTTFVDTNLVPATTYTYYLAALDASNTPSELTSAAQATTLADASNPTVPANLAATALSASEIKLEWTASTDDAGVAGYKIFRDGAEKGNSTTASFTDTGLLPSTTYAYQISAYDVVGKFSELSASTSAKTLAEGSAASSTDVKIGIMNLGKGQIKQINLKSNGIVKVSVQLSSKIGAKAIKLNSATMGGAKYWKHQVKDVNKDGIRDIIFSFRERDMKNLTDNGTSTVVFKVKTKSGEVLSQKFTVVVKGAPKKVKKTVKTVKTEKKTIKLETKNGKKIIKTDVKIEKKTIQANIKANVKAKVNAGKKK